MDSTNLIATQGVAVLLIPLLVRWLKTTPLVPWLTQDTAALNRTVAWGLGLLTAAGIHLSVEWAPAAQHLGLNLDWSATGLFHDLMIVAGQLGGQQFVYNQLKTLDLLQEVLQRASDPPRGAVGGGL